MPCEHCDPHPEFGPVPVLYYEHEGQYHCPLCHRAKGAVPEKTYHVKCHWCDHVEHWIDGPEYGENSDFHCSNCGYPHGTKPRT